MSAEYQEWLDLLNAQEAAHFLRMSRGALYVAVCRKQIPVIRWNGRLRFRRSALESFLKSLEVPAAGTPDPRGGRRGAA